MATFTSERRSSSGGQQDDDFALLRVERSVLDGVREGFYVVRNFGTPLTPGFLAKLKQEGTVYLPFTKEGKARGLFNSLVAGSQAALGGGYGA